MRASVSPQPQSADHGHWRWGRAPDGETATGLIIPATVLADGGEATAGHILHEAAHILCWVRGVKEVTVRGAYHNTIFLSAAEEVGLRWPAGERRTQQKGFSTVALTGSALTTLRRHLDAFDEVIPGVLPHVTVATPPRQRESRVTLSCRCTPARSFRITQSVADQGPIRCEVCGNRFT
ncbi:hypothetical protein SM8_029250 [Streptomyces sp. SM8]|nr:hypothetical protein SM8_029250 [Streptomyces sp. SM8]